MLLQVLNFPFPTAPDRDALVAAERTLRALGALDCDGALTERGRAMAALPLDPRPSRMILQVTAPRSEAIMPPIAGKVPKTHKTPSKCTSNTR